MEAGQEKVLIVDDDPAMTRMLQFMLERSGYVVGTATDGINALDAIEADCPHFVITDWEMPRMDGVELCRRIRASALPNYVYTVVLTARSGLAHAIEALQAGADNFLSKPVGPSELESRMWAGHRVLTLEQRLSLAAKHDGLTGLWNRAAFLDQLTREFTRTRRNDVPLSCVMFDIDFFKKINDTHGHAAGDEVLRRLGPLIRGECRTSDYACRYGGEEFCVLLPETNEAEAGVWAERIRRVIAQVQLQHDETPLPITASFGVAELHEDCQRVEDLLDQADQALLVAKDSSRNRVVLFGDLCKSSGDGRESSRLKRAAFASTCARDVMTAVALCLRPANTVAQVADLFLQLRTNSAPVVDEAGKLVGIVSEKDLISSMFAEGGLNSTIGDIMRTNVICYEEETPALEVYEFLCRVTIRRVVVVRDGKPTGTIGRGSLLRWYLNWMATNDTSTATDATHSGPLDPRLALRATAEVLAERTADLAGFLQHDCDDMVPFVVGEATRAQEFINDLLALSKLSRQLAGAGTVELF